MAYVVRHTHNPEYDVKRNWSAWIDGAWNSYEEAILDLIEEACDEDACEDDFDVRFNEAYGKWQHVHHDGLSCWELEAETEEEAIEEATENASEYDWHGFGSQTSGKVRFIAKITETLCLFEAEEVWIENDY